MGSQRRGFATAVFAVMVLAGSALVSFRATYDPDLWWHLAQGREVASGHLVGTNLFSFAYRDYPQSYTPWLFDNPPEWRSVYRDRAIEIVVRASRWP